MAVGLLITLFSMLTSCKGDPVESQSKESESVGGNPVWYDGLNFGGATLTVSQSVHVWDTAASIPNAEKVLDINNPAAAIKKYRENLPTYAGKLAEDISTFYQLED